MHENYCGSDAYVRMRMDEFLREAERDRLADLAAGPGRPVRARVAAWLVAAAGWIEGPPSDSMARAEA